MKLKKLVLLVICVVFIMVIFPSCNNHNIIVNYDSNKSPSIVNILSDHDIVWVDLKFNVTTKEFGEKAEIIKVRDIKKFTNKKVNIITEYNNKSVTIENIEYAECTGELDLVIYIMLLILLIIIILYMVVFLLIAFYKERHKDNTSIENI